VDGDDLAGGIAKVALLASLAKSSAPRGSNGPIRRIGDAPYNDDFAIAHYMITRSYWKIGDADNARIHLKKARKSYPDNPYFSENSLDEHNVVLILQLGEGPEKISIGLAGSLDTYRLANYREDAACVEASGRDLGRTSEAVDLFYQARTSGRSLKDAAQTAKGVVKTGLTAAALADDDPSPWLVAAALLFPAGADLRQWDLLPGELHVLSAKMQPGTYTFVIDFLNDGKPMPQYRQIWHHVPVLADRDTLLVFRSGRRKAGAPTAPRQNLQFTQGGESKSANVAKGE
jgi:hypothetical protein